MPVSVPPFLQAGDALGGPCGTAAAGAGLQAQRRARSEAPARASATARRFAKSPRDRHSSVCVTPRRDVLTTRGGSEEAWQSNSSPSAQQRFPRAAVSNPLNAAAPRTNAHSRHPRAAAARSGAGPALQPFVVPWLSLTSLALRGMPGSDAAGCRTAAAPGVTEPSERQRSSRSGVARRPHCELRKRSRGAVERRAPPAAPAAPPAPRRKTRQGGRLGLAADDGCRHGPRRAARGAPAATPPGCRARGCRRAPHRVPSDGDGAAAPRGTPRGPRRPFRARPGGGEPRPGPAAPAPAAASAGPNSSLAADAGGRMTAGRERAPGV